jgi:hypothetical protein
MDAIVAHTKKNYKEGEIFGKIQTRTAKFCIAGTSRDYNLGQHCRKERSGRASFPYL